MATKKTKTIRSIKKKSTKRGSKSETIAEVNESYTLYGTKTSTTHYLGNYSTVTHNKHDFIELIRKGINRKSLDLLMNITGISTTEIAAIMHTSDRTLRRYAPAKLLNPEQSERVIEIDRLYSRGKEVFGSLGSFKEWMDSSVLALGNKKPKTFLDTSLGIALLMEELGRIEQGVFA